MQKLKLEKKIGPPFSKLNAPNLIYQYLLEIGCFQTAKLLTKEKTIHPFHLKGEMPFSRMISRMAVEDFNFDAPKTKNFVDVLKALELDTKKSLFVVGDYFVYNTAKTIP